MAGEDWRAPALVAVAVLLNLASAVVLKLTSDHPDLSQLALASIVSGVILINLGRFAVWGYAHRMFPVSRTYPLSAVFFPIMALVATWFGEPMTVADAVGSSMIAVGVGLLIAEQGGA